MCSVPGYDASGHVEDLAAEQNTQITSIAIGEQGPKFCWAPGLGQAARAGPLTLLSGSRLSRGLQPGRQGHQHGREIRQVGHGSSTVGSQGPGYNLVTLGSWVPGASQLLMLLSLLQVGDAQERAPGTRVADAAGEETALTAATRLLPALPYHGDQPQGGPGWGACWGNPETPSSLCS